MTNGDGDVRLNWVALEGLWTFDAAEIRYEAPGSSPKSPYGLAICNRQLAGGRASVLVNFEKILDGGRTAAGIALGYQSESSGYILCQLGGYGAAYSISEYVPAKGWQGLTRTGTVGNLVGQRDYLLECVRRGQEIQLIADGVRVLQAYPQSTLVW